MLDSDHALYAMLEKLRSIAHLSDDDSRAIAAAPLTMRGYDAGQDIFVEGQQATHCCFLLSGWTCRHFTLPDGRNQILALNSDGDFIHLPILNMEAMDHTLTALTSAQVLCIPSENTRRLSSERPNFTVALMRILQFERAVSQQWLVSLGRRDARERLAHLLCETCTRLRAKGLAHRMNGELTFSWPMTQWRLGQILGLSPVHVNRTIQFLRDKGWIRESKGVVTILDWHRLQAFASFDPGYLGLDTVAA